MDVVGIRAVARSQCAEPTRAVVEQCAVLQKIQERLDVLEPRGAAEPIARLFRHATERRSDEGTRAPRRHRGIVSAAAPRAEKLGGRGGVESRS